MKGMKLILILLNVHFISSYLFDDPDFGEFKLTVKHDLLKGLRKQKKDEIDKRSGSKSRTFGPGCTIRDSANSPGSLEQYAVTSENCPNPPTLDHAIKTLNPSESLLGYTGIYDGANVKFSKFELRSGSQYQFYGKTESNFFPFWRIYGDLTVEVFVPGGSNQPNGITDVTVKIAGTIQRNDKNIEVEILKQQRIKVFEIRKFNSVSEGKFGVMGLLNYIQSGTAGSSFATAGSYFNADILDDMQWDQFTGSGSIDQSKKFTFVISSRNEKFPTTEENANMHLVIEGTADSAANFAFLSTFTAGRIMTTVKQFTTLDRNAVESYFEFGRVQSFRNWCYVLSSSDFTLQANTVTVSKYARLFTNCFDILMNFQYQMSQGSTIIVKEKKKGGSIACGNGQSLSMNQNNAQTYLSGHIEAFGMRWSYPSSSQSDVALSAVLQCLNSFNVVANVPDWFSSIIDGDVTAKFVDVYKKTGYKSFTVEININSGASVQNPLPTDLVKTFAIKKIQLQFEKYVSRAGQYSFYIDASLDGSNNIMAAMRFASTGWQFNLKVQSLTLKGLFDKLGPAVQYTPYGWSIVGETLVENLNVLIDLGRRKLIRATGTVTVKELPGIDVEAVYQAGNGFAVGLKCGNFNFEKVFEMIYEDVLNFGDPPQHTVPWLTSINSMIMLSTMSEEDDAKFHHPDLNTFEDMRAGVAFRFEWNRPDTQSEACTNDRFCTFLSEHFNEGGSFVLTGGYQNKVFQIEGELNADITITDYLLFSQARILLKADHSEGSVELTFGLGAELKYYTEGSADSLRTPLVFEGYVEISTDGAFKLLFTMIGQVDKPFGLPHISIADAQFGVERPEPQLKFIYIRIHMTLAIGNIEKIKKQENGEIFVPDDAISLKGTLGINPKVLYLSYFSLESPNPLTLGKLEDIFHINVLPDPVRQYGFQEKFLVQYAPNKIDDLPNGESINRGFRLKGQFKMLAWSGDADVNLDLTNLEFHADINMEPISWFWEAIQILDNEGANGPHLKMDISSNEFKGDISGSVQLFGFTTSATRLVFNEGGVLLKLALYNFFYLNLELYYELSPIKGNFIFGIREFSLEHFLIDKLNAAFDSMFGSAKQNEVRRAALERKKDLFWRQSRIVLEIFNGAIDRAQEEIRRRLGSTWSWLTFIPDLIIDGVQGLSEFLLEAAQFFDKVITLMTDELNNIGQNVRNVLTKFIQKNIEVKVNDATVHGSIDGLSAASMRVTFDVEYKFGTYEGRYNFDETYGEDSEEWRKINVDYFYEFTNEDLKEQSGYKQTECDILDDSADISIAESEFDVAFEGIEHY